MPSSSLDAREWRLKSACIRLQLTRYNSDILISIVRTYITSQPFDDFSTFLWKQALTIILSFAEPCVAIVCACLPVMRPLSKVFSKLFASSWLPLSGRSSHDTDRSGTAPISSECSVLEPVRSGPSVTNMVQGGFSSRWPLRDEEQAQKGIKVTSELDQFATGR